MFFGCENLEKLDLSSFNINNVTNMARMFNLCQNLEELNLTYFNTGNVINMMTCFVDVLI